MSSPQVGWSATISVGVGACADAVRGRGSASACCRPTAIALGASRPAVPRTSKRSHDSPRMAPGRRARRTNPRARTPAMRSRSRDRVLPHGEIADHADSHADPRESARRRRRSRRAAVAGSSLARDPHRALSRREVRRTALRPAPAGRCRPRRRSRRSRRRATVEVDAIEQPSRPRASAPRRRRIATTGAPAARARSARRRPHGAARPSASASCGLARAGGGRAATSRPLRSTAMRSRHAQHLVELVADEDHRQALRRRAAASVANSDSALLRRQHRRRLVQDQDRARRGTSAFRISTRWRSPTDSSATRASGSTPQAEALRPSRSSFARAARGAKTAATAARCRASRCRAPSGCRPA